MSKEKRRVPKLRFPGFTEDWEQRKLSDISTKVTTKNVDVHYTETLTNSAEQGIISQVDFFDKEISNKDNINGYYIVDNNDFIYNPRISTLAPVGPINRNKLNRTGIMSPLYTVFRSSNIDLSFLEWYFQSNHWHRYMKLNGDSGARADRIAIKDSTFFEMPIKIPVNIKEQVLIGETLEKFNQYITLHQRKLDNLKLKKKALLQKLFPKNGERYPELRFPGFTDAWEQRKLGDLAEIVRGASPRPISDPKWFNNDSDVGWLRIADVTAQDGRIRYLEQKISELGQEKTRVIKTPHLLLSIAATVGKPVINYVSTGVHDGFLIFLNPEFNILYTFWWLEMFREKWNKYGQPGSQVNLNSDLVKNQVIDIPNEKEQEKISLFLESLDKIITLHQRKLDHLQLQKKALLQQMFV